MAPMAMDKEKIEKPKRRDAETWIRIASLRWQ
jgi:hypothetical protein